MAGALFVAAPAHFAAAQAQTCPSRPIADMHRQAQIFKAARIPPGNAK
jgi:hypothetical protein